MLVVLVVVLVWAVASSLGGGEERPRASASSPTSAQRTPNEQVVADARAALEAWGVFATNGDLKRLEGVFLREGPQYKQLAGEAPDLAARPAGPPPYKFALTPSDVIERDGGERVVRGTVKMTRPGVKDRTFQWDIFMRPVPDSDPPRWALWTVDETKKQG